MCLTEIVILLIFVFPVMAKKYHKTFTERGRRKKEAKQRGREIKEKEQREMGLKSKDLAWNLRCTPD